MKSGVYIHFPFCRSKCNYCSFVSRTWDESLGERYRRAVIHELESFAPELAARPAVDTVFLGGGTPSLLPAGHVESVLEACRRRFELTPGCEVSLEANPGTLTREKLDRYIAAGVNRISLGAQSFCDDELLAIRRIHMAGQIGTSCGLLRDAGLSNFNLDLIIGLPGQTEASWRSTLRAAAALEPAHVSVYMLELDAGAPLRRMVESGQCSLPGEDAVADWYLMAIDVLAAESYFQYEISNFAHPGCECRHNLKYWRRDPVLGFGASAHSFDIESRYANCADPDAYLEAMETGRPAMQWREPVDDIRSWEETMFLGLRLADGVDWRRVKDLGGGFADGCESSMREMVDEGLLEWQGERIRLTRRGMLLSNEVFQRFIQLRESRGQ